VVNYEQARAAQTAAEKARPSSGQAGPAITSAFYPFPMTIADENA
jgi:hypothetical protein